LPNDIESKATSGDIRVLLVCKGEATAEEGSPLQKVYRTIAEMAGVHATWLDASLDWAQQAGTAALQETGLTESAPQPLASAVAALHWIHAVHLARQGLPGVTLLVATGARAQWPSLVGLVTGSGDEAVVTHETMVLLRRREDDGLYAASTVTEFKL
jgi:hypothetical protein